MKRLICFILILLMLTPFAMADEQKMTFRVESVSGKVGDTVTVTGLVENAPVCASFRVILTYDSTVLQPVDAAKIDCKGLFMKNTAYTHKGQPAINVLSADANKALEGNMKLFSVTFKILAESPETDGSPIKVAHQEFFDPSTPKPKQVQPIVEEGRVFVGDDKPAAEQPENPTTPEDPTTPENPTTPEDPADPETPNAPEDPTTPDTPTTPEDPAAPDNEGAADSDAPADNATDETPEAPESDKKEEDKKPTGSWITDPETDDLYHVDEEGNTTVFKPEYTEKPEPGKVTDVVLKDKETGENAGSIKVEGNEDGSFNVIEQDVPSLEKDDSEGDETDKKPISVWVWIGIGAAVVAAGAAAVWYFLIYPKKIKD